MNRAFDQATADSGTTFFSFTDNARPGKNRTGFREFSVSKVGFVRTVTVLTNRCVVYPCKQDWGLIPFAADQEAGHQAIDGMSQQQNRSRIVRQPSIRAGRYRAAGDGKENQAIDEPGQPAEAG